MPTRMQADYSTVLWDGDKPYWRGGDGSRIYIPPLQAAQYANDPRMLAYAASQGATPGNPTGGIPQGGLFHQAGEWNDQTGEQDQPLDWGHILSLAIAGGMGGPAAYGALAGGGGGGAAASIPTTMGIADASSLGLPATAGLGSAGAAGAGGGVAASLAGADASLLPSIPTTMGVESATSLGLPVTEGLGTAGMAGIPTTMGLANGNGVGTQMPSPSMNDVSGLTAGNGLPGSLLTDPKWSALLKTLAGVGGLVGGNVLGKMGQEDAVPPQLTQLLDLALQRAHSQTPLFNAANKGLYEMLPTFAKGGQ